MAMTAKTTKSVRGAQARIDGERLEVTAMAALRGMGYIVNRIATPTRVIRGRAIRTAAVAGDLFGCTDTGRALLVECKSRKGGGCTPSDFEAHQLRALQAWAKAGGLALVASWDESGRKVVLQDFSQLLEVVHAARGIPE